MASAFKLLGSTSVTSGTAGTLSLTSIPQTHTDMQIMVSTRLDVNTATQVASAIRFNGVTTGYTISNLRGNGSSVVYSLQASTTDLPFYAAPNDYTAGAFATAIFYIPNYTASGTKQIILQNAVSQASTTGWIVYAASSVNSGAITSIELGYDHTGGSANQNTYTSIYAYGIKNS